MRLLRTLALAAGVAGLAGPAFAQGPFGRGILGAGMMLQNEQVQKELKLTDEQVAKGKEVAKKLEEKYQPEMLKLRDLDREARREKMQELRHAIGEEAAKEMEGVLTTEQRKRFREIRLQLQGAPAFLRGEVARRLKLTDDQKQQIKTIAEDAGKEMRELRRNARGNAEEAAKKIAALQQESVDKVTALLSDDQKKTWKEMTGEPFHLKPDGLRRRRASRNG